MNELLSKIIVLVTLLALPFPLFADEDEPGREIKVHETSEGIARPRIPDYDLVISCFVTENDIWLFTSTPEWLQVDVRNNTTGTFGTYQILDCSEGYALPLLGEGYYEMSILTISGRRYCANFLI